jgi:hypothetical protein
MADSEPPTDRGPGLPDPMRLSGSRVHPFRRRRSSVLRANAPCARLSTRPVGSFNTVAFTSAREGFLQSRVPRIGGVASIGGGVCEEKATSSVVSDFELEVEFDGASLSRKGSTPATVRMANNSCATTWNDGEGLHRLRRIVPRRSARKPTLAKDRSSPGVVAHGTTTRESAAPPSALLR